MTFFVMWMRLWWSDAASLFMSGFKADESRTRAEPWRLDPGNQGNKQICMLAKGVNTNPEMRVLCTQTHIHTHLDSTPCIQNRIKLVGRATQCNFVGVQNGFWLQACGRIVDPLIQHREDAVHPLSSLYRVMRAWLNQWTFTPCTVSFSQHEARLPQRFQNEVWKSQRPCKSFQDPAHRQRSTLHLTITLLITTERRQIIMDIAHTVQNRQHCNYHLNDTRHFTARVKVAILSLIVCNGNILT